MTQQRNIKVDDRHMLAMMRDIDTLQKQLHKGNKRVIPKMERQLDEERARMHRLGDIIKGRMAEMIEGLNILYGIETLDDGYSWHIDMKTHTLRRRRNPERYGRGTMLFMSHGFLDGEEWKHDNNPYDEEEEEHIDWEDDGESLKEKRAKEHWKKNYEQIDWQNSEEDSSRDNEEEDV